MRGFFIKIKIMQIFNVEIFGSCADWFMNQSCVNKKDWIKKNTNQSSDILIDEFIKTCNRGNDNECEGCKKAKINDKDNISSGVPTKEPITSTIGEDTSESRTVSANRQKPKPKRG
jgi:hypothetical protein